MRLLLVEDDSLLGNGSQAGLRLSIVARIAELHRASLSLTTAADGHGLSVMIVFSFAHR